MNERGERKGEGGGSGLTMKDLDGKTKERAVVGRREMNGIGERIVIFLSDMAGRSPLYRNSPVTRELVSHIKRDGSVLSRIGALREMNLEYFAIDSQVQNKTGGQPEKKDVLLEDHDPIWLELRHAHIADAGMRLHKKMTNFVSKNRAAQIGSRDGGELSTRDLQKMVQALPQYSEQIEKLSLHVDIAGKIDKIISESGLKEVGELEQNLVFGDAGTKELIIFLELKRMFSRENKLRLLMIYAAVNPEKFDDGKITKLMDKKNAARKDRDGEIVALRLSRFYPIIEELVEQLSKGELPSNDYPCMNDPSPTFHGTSSPQAASIRTGHIPTPYSKRSRRAATWARPRNSDDGYSSDSILRHASSNFKKMGQRIFVFMLLRVCHKLSDKLQREIVLGSSSLDDPPQFITVHDYSPPFDDQSDNIGVLIA
ncbi:hypothetical protein RD792_006662 [Penstemon davidsonii]|uniref:Uncharacterized protein n=1 Tax=Penstemon davidsonii TaxID=160366 RepID=A0ABR0DCR6_9LAMI|nr:hypothetical protein RD792_006662 [Penstemon davidsonii]